VTFAPATGGAPRLSGRVVASATDAHGFYVDIAVTNTGTGSAADIRLVQLAFKTLTGSGVVPYNGSASPPLPRIIGGLDPGGSTSVRFYLNVNPGVARCSFTAKLTARALSGTTQVFIIEQRVTP
jgi:hypothetical protein